MMQNDGYGPGRDAWAKPVLRKRGGGQNANTSTLCTQNTVDRGLAPPDEVVARTAKPTRCAPALVLQAAAS